MQINHKTILDNAAHVGKLQHTHKQSNVHRVEKKKNKELTETTEKGETVDISSAALTATTETAEEESSEKSSQSRSEKHLDRLEKNYGEPKPSESVKTKEELFARKHGNTRLKTLEKTYGKIAPEGWDRNMTLKQLLDRTGHPSLTQLVKHKKEVFAKSSKEHSETKVTAKPKSDPVVTQKEVQQPTKDQAPPPSSDPPPSPPPPPPTPLPNDPLILQFLQDRAVWRNGYRNGFSGGTSSMPQHPNHPVPPSWYQGFGQGFEDGTFTAQLIPPTVWRNGAVYNNPFGSPQHAFPQGHVHHHHPRPVPQEPVEYKKSLLMDPPEVDQKHVHVFPDKEGNTVRCYDLENGNRFYDKKVKDGSREQKITDSKGHLIRQVNLDTDGNQVCTTYAKDGSSKVETSDGKVMVFDDKGKMVDHYVETPEEKPAQENFWQRIPEDARQIDPDRAVTKNLMRDDSIKTYALPGGGKFSEVHTAHDGKEHQVLTDKKGNIKYTVSRDPQTGEQVRVNYGPDGAMRAESNTGNAVHMDEDGRAQMYEPDGRPVMGNNYDSEDPYMQRGYQDPGMGYDNYDRGYDPYMQRGYQDPRMGYNYGMGYAPNHGGFWKDLLKMTAVGAGVSLLGGMMLPMMGMGRMWPMMSMGYGMMPGMGMGYGMMPGMGMGMGMGYGLGSLMNYGMMNAGTSLMSSFGLGGNFGLMNLAFPGAGLTGLMGTTGFGLW